MQLDILSSFRNRFSDTQQVEGSSRKIKKLADKLNWKHNQAKMRGGIPPIYAEKIITKEGLKLKQIPFTGEHATHVTMLEKSSKTIYITDNQDLLRTWGNFAVAYELGHYLMHEGNTFNFDPSIIATIALSKIIPELKKEKEEQEASHFASYLLMPDVILADMPEYHFRNIAGEREEGSKLFADTYIVPPEVAILRKQLLQY